MHAQLTEAERITEGRQRAWDYWLKQRLERALRQSPYPQVRRVEPDVDGGHAILRGTVASFYPKQQAQTAAMRVAGIETVENRIEVCSS